MPDGAAIPDNGATVFPAACRQHGGREGAVARRVDQVWRCCLNKVAYFADSAKVEAVSDWQLDYIDAVCDKRLFSVPFGAAYQVNLMSFSNQSAVKFDF